MGKTCSTCKHWKKDDYGDGSIGQCSKITSSQSFPRARICSQGVSFLVTAQEFGCTLHEEKPRGFKVGDKVLWRGISTVHTVVAMFVDEENAVSVAVLRHPSGGYYTAFPSHLTHAKV